MIWVTAEDVVAIHSRIIQVSGGIDGLRDRAGLEAAIAAPLQSFGGEDLFPTDIEKIARIGFGLASNHAFIDGNKRIGAMVTQLLLKWNGYQFQLEQNELADMFIGIADGTKDESNRQISRRIKKHLWLSNRSWARDVHSFGILHSWGALAGKSCSAQASSIWLIAGAFRRTQSK